MVSQGGVHQKSDRVCFVKMQKYKRYIKKALVQSAFLNEYLMGSLVHHKWRWCTDFDII